MKQLNSNLTCHKIIFFSNCLQLYHCYENEVSMYFCVLNISGEAGSEEEGLPLKHKVFTAEPQVNKLAT